MQSCLLAPEAIAPDAVRLPITGDTKRPLPSLDLLFLVSGEIGGRLSQSDMTLAWSIQEEQAEGDARSCIRFITHNVAEKLECPAVCKVEMSDWSLHCTATSPDLSG
jgi:hypothetical protein